MIQAFRVDLSARQVEPHIWKRVRAGDTWSSIWRWRSRVRCGCIWSSWCLSATGLYFCKARPEDQTRERTRGSERNPLPGTTSFFPLVNVFPCCPPFCLAFKISLLSFGCFVYSAPPFSVPCFSPCWHLFSFLVSLFSLTLYMPLFPLVLSHSFTLNIFLQLPFHTGLSRGGLRSQFSLDNIKNSSAGDWVLQREHRLEDRLFRSLVSTGIRAKKSASFLPEVFAWAIANILGHLCAGAVPEV